MHTYHHARPQPARLAMREETFLIPGPQPGLMLFLRYLPRTTGGTTATTAVLSVHGATFPSALAIAYRFDGRSWRDALCDEGWDVWALDFYGFGHSDRYAQMQEAADRHPPLGTAEVAERQIASAVTFIRRYHHLPRISLIAHSWGCMPAGRFAGNQPEQIDRLVFVAPITWRSPTGGVAASPAPAWRTVSVPEQWSRFQEDLPAHEGPLLSRDAFTVWAEHYLDSDPGSRSCDPPRVLVPNGPTHDIQRAWQGALAYDPGRIRAPVAIIRGAWDHLVTDADARWLFDALVASPMIRDVTISHGTHLLHLERTRTALWRESAVFLRGEEPAIQDASAPFLTSTRRE